MEECGKIWKNGCFTGRLRPDWGNTAWATMAGLGSTGLILKFFFIFHKNKHITGPIPHHLLSIT